MQSANPECQCKVPNEKCHKSGRVSDIKLFKHFNATCQCKVPNQSVNTNCHIKWADWMHKENSSTICISIGICKGTDTLMLMYECQEKCGHPHIYMNITDFDIVQINYNGLLWNWAQTNIIRCFDHFCQDPWNKSCLRNDATIVLLGANEVTLVLYTVLIARCKSSCYSDILDLCKHFWVMQ